MGSSEEKSEALRLEELWSGQFGNAYVDRNNRVGDVRGPFWSEILQTFPTRRALEVGCNLGANLRWVVDKLPPGETYGIDINQKAIQTLHAEFPGVNALVAPARELPFRDCWFDLVVTMGVLIHQPPEILPVVMSEIVRCARRWVLCGEYFADQPTEVPYRGETGALFKRDFGATYQQLFPGLVLRKKGFLSRSDGWDDVTYWVFEKP
jgi:pseudaminic acid biosynthesis-associated methylase